MATYQLTTLFILTILGTSFGVVPDIGLNTVEMIENHGYPCESHYITTEDGYILTYHRIPHGQNDDGSGKKPPVLLMHGLISSSADYVNMGPNVSLSYLLADLGYDVWLGNARGNGWSRNHTNLDINSEEFFDFSWHEIGYYDLPAAIDYILGVNGADGLSYVGHSQGCTSFLVMGATRPEYTTKVKIASLMGPASFMNHQTNAVLDVLAKYIYDLEKVLFKYKIYELPYPELLRAGASEICSDPENYKLCLNVIGLVDGVDAPQLEQEKFPIILSNAPSNAATKQFLHYGQLIKNGWFAQYDHGTEQNQAIYGSDTPPAYDLSGIQTPVAVYYGLNDGLVNYMDAETVIKSLPNVVNDYPVPLDAFNHIDFLFAKDLVDLVYIELIKVMQSY